MIDYLSKERLGIMLTTHCPLRCRGCYLMIPEQAPWEANPEDVAASLPRIFAIFPRFEQVCLMGGEPFLYRNLPQILAALNAYKSQFGFVRVVTSATVLPRQDVLTALQQVDYHADVRISNYGKVSRRYDDLVAALKEHNIHTTIVNYTDEEQYCGGWVEFGVNWEYRHYTPERIAELYDNCNYKTFFNWGRYIYRCPTVSGAVQLGKLVVPDNDKIDLFSDESLESKQAKVQELINRPQEACEHCDSFDALNGVRFRAGEQLP